jgi:hypothetical protein
MCSCKKYPNAREKKLGIEVAKTEISSQTINKPTGEPLWLSGKVVE